MSTIQVENNPLVKEYKQPKHNAYFFTFLNSLAAYLIASIIAIFIYNGFSALMANLNSLVVYFSFNKFGSDPGPGVKWDSNNVALTYGAGAAFSFIFFLFFIVIYNFRIKLRDTNLKFIFLWLCVQTLNYSLGAFIASVLTMKLRNVPGTYKGLGHLLQWLYVSRSIKIALLLGSIIIMFVAGIAFTKLFYQTAKDRSLIGNESKNNRLIYLLCAGFIPYVVGAGLLMLISINTIDVYNWFLLVTPGFMLLPMISFYHFRHNPQLVRSNKKYTNLHLNVMALLGVLIAIVLVFFLKVYTIYPN